MASIEPLTGSAIEAAVLQRSGPIALDFYQASCPPCRVLEPRLERIAQQYAGRISVYRVDIDRDLPIAERFGVTSLPTVLIFVAGNEVARLDGLITEAILEAAFGCPLGEATGA